MIKALAAYTAEVDDVNLAVEQIKSQLGNLDDGLFKNTIGIISCHYEYVNSGVFKAICDTLPFETVGTISSAQSVPGVFNTLLFTLLVLTSDDVAFIKTLTPSLTSEPGKHITEAYTAACRSAAAGNSAAADRNTAANRNAAAGGGGEKPDLILVFAPFMIQNSGDEYVNVLSDISGGAPCFGTIAVDDTLDFSNCFLLADGEYYRDKMALVLFYGEGGGKVKPKFYVANISENRMLSTSAVVTKSAGPVLMEVNERPVIEYFDNLGLVKASETQYAMSSLPFLLDYNDGTPKVSKIFVALTPEKFAICAGAMPEGSTLYMATTDRDDVLLTTSDAIDSIVKDIPDSSVILVYSCISRSMTLAADQFMEMELLNEKIAEKLPYMMVFSGGEICPTHLSSDKAINRFHNNAFIACLF